MSYLAQASMTKDNYLTERIAACAATLGITDARLWATNNLWSLSAHPGWKAAYAYALGDVDVTDPGFASSVGADPNVISDQMILEGVNAIISPNLEPEVPDEPEGPGEIPA